jgi:hypothetical protein
VGDDYTVELLPGRLPNATSAAAVVHGHLVEVENAANNAGNSARIRVLDVDEDDDYVLAEVTEVGAVAAAKKTRRRKRRAPLTAAQQTAQLRELAKEAADQHEARVPIGITTATEEEEARDKALSAEAKAEKRADAIVISEGEVRHGEVHLEAVSETGEGNGRRRRRRRRRRGRGGDEVAAQVGISAQSVSAQLETAPVEGDGHHRRRRRRRRGRRGSGNGTPAAGRIEPMTGALPQRPGVPDRHIFRVGSDGNAEPTGQTAPREPSRAIATLRRAHPPAVEAPPPALRVPEPEAKPTKPARRRRVATKSAEAKLESSPIEALPAPKTTLVRARPKGSETAVDAVAEKPATRRKSRVAKTANDGEATAQKSPVRKPSSRKTGTTRSRKKKTD